MSTFFSYRESCEELVHRVKRILAYSLSDIIALWEEHLSDDNFLSQMKEQVPKAENFVLFAPDEGLGKYQVVELDSFHQLLIDGEPGSRDGSGRKRRLIVVCLFDKARGTESEFFGKKLALCSEYTRIYSPRSPDNVVNALAIALELAAALRVQWRYIDGLPADPHLFDYEKHIIKYFEDVSCLFPKSKGNLTGSTSELSARSAEVFNKWLKGCPEEWPEVDTCGAATHPNKLDPKEIGDWRASDARVFVTALKPGACAQPDSGSNPKDCTAVAPEASAQSSSSSDSRSRTSFTFLEAGPREMLYFAPGGILRVAIMVSGGIAPGVNAVIDGITQRHWQYARRHGGSNNLEVYGLLDGFLSFKHNRRVALLADRNQPKPSEWDGRFELTPKHAHEGGSILGTSRVAGLLHADDRVKQIEDIDTKLLEAEIDILYVLGGDGTMKAAHALHEVACRNPDRLGRKLSVVAIPKTMDNDILWVWQSFGFLSAVEKAREVIEHLSTEVESNPRIVVVQLFGSDSGFVVSHAVQASSTGHCIAALIPEVEFSMKGERGLIAHVRDSLSRPDGRAPHGIIVMAETAIPKDAEDYIDDPYIGLSSVPEEQGRKARDPVTENLAEKEELRRYLDLRADNKRIQGQTETALRSAGLKIVSRGLLKGLLQDNNNKNKPEQWKLLRVFTNEPRHLLRAIPPSCLDIINGQRLGTLAVDNAMAGYTDFMISQWLTEYVLVPLELVVLGRKRIPQTGMFWKSVVGKTGQPAVMVDTNLQVAAKSAAASL